MQIFLKNSTGKIQLPVESGRYNLNVYYNLIEVVNDKENIRITNLGGEEEYEAGTYHIPIYFNEKNKAFIAIKSEDVNIKLQFKLENAVEIDENVLFNLMYFTNKLTEEFAVGQKYAVSELINSIHDNKVNLLVIKEPFSGYDDQSLLNSISEVIPMIMDICSHPKQSLRTEEAILDVNLVKRINSNTMKYLSSHSEHWKARTLNGLIPNRLRADIFEDDINIYENLFFRMAVDDILKYVHRQADSIEKTIKQNNGAIDWNKYGDQLGDYKRRQIFEKLLPDYNISEKINENDTLIELLTRWKKLERQFSTVEASQFFKSIDKKKHISRNIHPTNIIKKDSRYNALYRLWCTVQRQISQEQQKLKGVTGDVNFNLCNYYSIYAITLMLYSFELLECHCMDDSIFELTDDGGMKVNAVFENKNMRYTVKTIMNQYDYPEIEVILSDKKEYMFNIPESCLPYKHLLVNSLPEGVGFNISNDYIVFYGKLTTEKQREIEKIFKISQSAAKGMDKNEKYMLDKADIEWRQKLENLFVSNLIPEANNKKIHILPQLAIPDTSDIALDKFTSSLLNGVGNETIVLLPFEIDLYKNIKEKKLLHRLINYGEKYDEVDADKWGNYNVGILPVSQLELYSAQRLMKLISTHTAISIIKWSSQKKICPICGTDNCTNDGNGSWKCNNPDCGILFGTTKCADGCGNQYEWTRPYMEIEETNIKSDNEIDLMQAKEYIFDRLTITDFSLVKECDGKIKYIPICPICGKK